MLARVHIRDFTYLGNCVVELLTLRLAGPSAAPPGTLRQLGSATGLRHVPTSKGPPWAGHWHCWSIISRPQERHSEQVGFILLEQPAVQNRWGNIAASSCLLARARSSGVTLLAGILLACVWHYHLTHFRRFSLSPANFFPCLEISVKIWRYRLSLSIRATALDSVKIYCEIQEGYICNFLHLFFA